MSEQMTYVFDFIRENWAKVLLIITTPIVGGISIWQLLMFFVNLVKDNTAKKYFKPSSAKYKKKKKEFEAMQESFKIMLAEFKAENTNNIKTVIAEFMASYEETKRLIYNDIVNVDDELLNQLPEQSSIDIQLDDKLNNSNKDIEDSIENPEQITDSNESNQLEDKIQSGEML